MIVSIEINILYSLFQINIENSFYILIIYVKTDFPNFLLWFKLFNF